VDGEVFCTVSEVTVFAERLMLIEFSVPGLGRIAAILNRRAKVKRPCDACIVGQRVRVGRQGNANVSATAPHFVIPWPFRMCSLS